MEPILQQKIIQEYITTKLSQKELAEKYKISAFSVGHMLRKNKIKKPKSLKTYHNKIDKINCQEIVDEYIIQGKTQAEILKKYKMDHELFMKIFKRLNVELAPRGSWSRKYFVNDDFLDKIDSYEKAVFIGMFFADGYNNGKHYVSIGLKESDKEYLENFSRLIFKNERPLYINNCMSEHANERQVVLCITSKKFIDKLNDLGAPRKKSLILKWPTQIPNELMRYFIRGYFDGDGSVYKTQYLQRTKYKNKVSVYRRIRFGISISGMENFLSKMALLLKQELNINSQFVHKNKNNSNGFGALCIGGNKQVLKFLDYIYSENPDFSLKRKYNLYTELKNSYEQIKYAKKIDEFYITKKES